MATPSLAAGEEDGLQPGVFGDTPSSQPSRLYTTAEVADCGCKMDIDQRMSRSLDDIIKEKKQDGTKKPKQAAGKPAGRVKVATVNRRVRLLRTPVYSRVALCWQLPWSAKSESLHPKFVVQKPKAKSGKQQSSQTLGVQRKGLKVQNVGKRRAAVPLKGSQKKTGKGVAVATGRNTRAGRTDRTVKQPNLSNVKVTIRNEKVGQAVLQCPFFIGADPSGR